MSWLASILAALIGFWAVGYCWTRLLRSSSSLVAAFLVSIAALVQVVMLFVVIGVPIRLPWVTIGLAGVAMLPWVLMRVGAVRRGAALALGDDTAPAYSGKGASIHLRLWQWFTIHSIADRVLLSAVAAVGALFLAKALLQPLTGWDTLFRWDFLAIKILEHANLDYYPPVTPADHRTYFYVDSISPLVSLGNWLLYAAHGNHEPRITAMFVFAQLVAALVLAYRLGVVVGGSPRAGVLAAAALASAPMFLRSVHIGQETGLTAIAVLATAYYTTAAPRDRPWGDVIVAGVAAGLGALAREYGWVLLPIGASMLAVRRVRFAPIAVFAVTCIFIAAPWYLRTWVRTGNPFYSIDVAGLFTVNPIYHRLMLATKSLLGISTFSVERWHDLLLGMAARAALPMLVGIIGAIWLLRRVWWLSLMAAVFTVLWLYSIGMTQGGVIYSTRVLSPVWALLAVAAGTLLAHPRLHRGANHAITAIALVALAWSLLFLAMLPLDARGVPMEKWPEVVTLTEVRPRDERRIRLELPQRASQGLRILSDSNYLHAELAGLPYDVVPVWSPEVRFIFDPSLDAVEVRRRLLRQGIGAVAWYHSNINNPVLESTAFYSQDRARWRPAIDFGFCVIYALPLK